MRAARCLATVLGLLVVPACGGSGPTPPSVALDEPAKELALDPGVDPAERPASRHPLVVALDVLKRGLQGLPAPAEEEEWDYDVVEGPFEGVDRHLRDFLGYGMLKPAVPWGCARIHAPEEDRIEAALGSADPAVRVQALAVLVHVQSASSVPRQWRVLRSLHGTSEDARFHRLLSALESRFAAPTLMKVLGERGTKLATGAPGLGWVMRAAGVTQCWAALPRLRAYAVSGSHSLAAGRSLEDFEGPEAEEALLACALGWNCAARSARYALLQRDPQRLADGLLRQHRANEHVTEGHAVARAMAIGLAHRPEAVPLLCAAASRVGFRDEYRLYRLIEALATAEHLPLVRAMVREAPPEQEKRAAEALAAVLQRLASD